MTTASPTDEVRRHPWNTSFSWESHDGPLRILTAEQAAQFDRDGFVVLHDLFDPERVRALVEEIDAHESKLEAFLRQAEGERFMIAEAGAITFTTHLVTRSDLLREFATDPVFLDLCADLIGADVNFYWDQAVYKKPEKPRRFPWHQDNGYAFVEPQQYLTCWVALTDATVENGCPQVARGRHTSGTLQHTYVDPLGWECFSEPPDVAVAEVGAGGAVVFSSLTPHMTGPNRTADARKAYILQYAPAGAEVLHGDPLSDTVPERRPADDPQRQFPVLRDGRPVA